MIQRADSTRFHKQIIPIALFTSSLIAYAGLVNVHFRTGTLTHASLPETLPWVALAFGVYILAIVWAERQRAFPIYLLWGGAILFHTLLWFTTPTLSDDVYRYLWDGHVANQGVSPYAYPIDSPELDPLDVPIRALANHRWMASPYLPAAQWLFASVTRVFPLHPTTMQVAMSIATLLAGLPIAALLTLAGLPRYRLLIYLWNPLIIVEIAHGAHLDAWMVLLMMLALWLTFRQPQSNQRATRIGRTILAPILLALATLTKIIPIVLLAVLFWRWRWRELLLYGAVVSALLLPAGQRAGWGISGPLDGHGLFGALRIYGDQWNYNSGLFHWLEEDLVESTRLDLSLEAANRMAKRFMLIVMAGIGGTLWLIARKVTSIRASLRLMAIPWGAYVLLTPTVHPWYLVPLIAFVPFLPPAQDEPARQWIVPAPALYLSFALFFSYLTYLDPNDLRELEWVRRLEWLPTLALLLIACYVVASCIWRNLYTNESSTTSTIS